MQMKTWYSLQNHFRKTCTWARAEHRNVKVDLLEFTANITDRQADLPHCPGWMLVAWHPFLMKIIVVKMKIHIMLGTACLMPLTPSISSFKLLGRKS